MQDTPHLDALGGPQGAAAVRFIVDEALVELSGEHDLATVDVVDQAFAAAEAASPPLLIVDLSACSFIDSTIVRTLLLARERATDCGRRVVLVHTTPPAIMTVLEISGLAELFDSYETVDEALAPGRRDSAASTTAPVVEP